MLRNSADNCAWEYSKRCSHGTVKVQPNTYISLFKSCPVSDFTSKTVWKLVSFSRWTCSQFPNKPPNNPTHQKAFATALITTQNTLWEAITEDQTIPSQGTPFSGLSGRNTEESRDFKLFSKDLTQVFWKLYACQAQNLKVAGGFMESFHLQAHSSSRESRKSHSLKSWLPFGVWQCGPPCGFLQNILIDYFMEHLCFLNELELTTSGFWLQWNENVLTCWNRQAAV